MTLKQLFADNHLLIEELYKGYENNITHTAVEFSERLNIEYTDSIRRQLSAYISTEINCDYKRPTTKNVLIYDIETSLIRATVFWTGKQYVSHTQLMDEPKIITICYKWLGDDKVHELVWDNENKCDKKLVREFLKFYNHADVVVGINNDNFDNRFVNARAMKYGYSLNPFTRSFDIQKKAKRHFRIPSYSMSYLAKYLGLDGKFEHSGRIMWENIQFGSDVASKSSLEEMIIYNRQDVITTEQLYLRLRPYMVSEMHFGVAQGDEKWTCPECGGKNVELYKTTITPAGTIQRIMECKEDGVKYKINNKTYLNFLDNKREQQ